MQAQDGHGSQSNLHLGLKLRAILLSFRWELNDAAGLAPPGRSSHSDESAGAAWRNSKYCRCGPRSDLHTFLLVSSLFPGRNWIRQYQAHNTINNDATRKEGSSEVLPNSDGRVLVYAVACCFCHVGSGGPSLQAGSLPAAIDILEGKHIGHN